MSQFEFAEIGNLVRQVVEQTLADRHVFRFGYISNYDPATHRVRCIIPSMRDENDQPSVSPWMPLGSHFVGASGAGIQWFPKAQATTENPMAGEQCMIVPTHPMRGTAAVPCMFFSGANLPPAPSLPDGRTAAGGDFIIRTSGGTVSWMHDSTGDIEQIIAGKLIQTVTGNATITTQGDATITATNQVTVTGMGAVKVTGATILLNGATDARPVARIGDSVSTGGVITSGSSTVSCGG